MQSFGVVFPGQGSQSVGMLASMGKQYAEVKATFTEASDELHYDLWQLVQDGPAIQLDKTVHTQPALLTASYAIWRILNARIKMCPSLLAGHSLGEYTALVCAGAFSFSDAVKLVQARGQFMQEAVSDDLGGMAAIIGLEDQAVAMICEQVTQANEIVTPANFNSPGQIVIAGHKAAVERAITLAKEKGAKMAVMLPVSVPSHCKLMLPAAERLAQLLATIDIKLPQIPVINNADVLVYQAAQDIRAGLTKQLYMPVRWVETIHYLVKKNITTIIECGLGKVLTGLNKRIDKQLQLFPLAEAENIEALLKLLEDERGI